MILIDHLFRRYQVFISSTFKDLEKERAELWKGLVEQGYLVEGMERFPAADRKQWEVIKERIDKSDLYVLIIAHKYGSTTTDAHEWEPEVVKSKRKVSFTQLEFLYARHRKKPVLAFIKKDRAVAQDAKSLIHAGPSPGSIADQKTETKEEKERREEKESVDSFIKEVQTSGLMTDSWTEPSDLLSDVIRALSEQTGSEGFASANGWVRASTLHHPIDNSNKAVFLGSKMHYVKFVSHAHRSAGRPPLYRKRVHRVNKEFDVWDEYNTITVNCFSHCLNAFKFYTRTDGDAVDFTVLFPYVNKLTFSDEKEGLRDNIFNPTIESPSNVYTVATSYLNGFQKGNTDIATKATHPARVLRLVADFSSLPDHQRRFKLRACVEVDPGSKETNITGEVRSIQPGIHMVERYNVPKDHVLKFKFDLIG